VQRALDQTHQQQAQAIAQVNVLQMQVDNERQQRFFAEQRCEQLSIQLAASQSRIATIYDELAIAQQVCCLFVFHFSSVNLSVFGA